MKRYIIVSSDFEDPVNVYHSKESVEVHLDFYRKNLRTRNFVIDVYEAELIASHCFEQDR